MPASLLASQFADARAARATRVDVDIRDSGRRAGRRRSARLALAAAQSSASATLPMSDDAGKPLSPRDARGRTSAAIPRSTSARSTRRSTARRRSCSRRSPTSRRRRRRATRASATACTACRRSPTCRRRSPTLEGGTRRLRRAVRPDRDDVAAARADAGRRPRAGHRLGLRADAPVLRLNTLPRYGVEVAFYDPLGRRRRSSSAMTPNTRDRVRRVAGLARRSRCRTCPAIAAVAHAHGALRRARQHVGDAARLSRVRPRRRRLGARGDQVHRRPLATCCSASSSATRRRAAPMHRLWTDMGVAASTDDCVPRPARAAHAADAPRPPPGERAAHRDVAARAARGARGALPGAARRARARRCGSATSRARAGCSASCCSPVDARRARRDARRHAPVRHGLELGRLREPDHPDLTRSARAP